MRVTTVITIIARDTITAGAAVDAEAIEEVIEAIEAVEEIDPPMIPSRRRVVLRDCREPILVIRTGAVAALKMNVLHAT